LTLFTSSCYTSPHIEMEKTDLREIMEVLKALSDEKRVRILYALRSGELCVCQVIALLNLAPSTVSKHLKILRAARLIDSRKNGRWMYYRLSKDCRVPSAGKLLYMLFNDMESATVIAHDRKRLKLICREGREALCRKLFGKQ